MKLKIKLPVLKQRNPFAEEIQFRKSGAHQKSNKAKRKGNKDALKKQDLDLV